MKLIDLSGNRYGKLIVVSRSLRSGKNGEVIFSCVCDCGNTTDVFASNLRSGYTASCGCVRNSLSSNRMKLQSYGRTHTLNEDFFCGEITEEVAYWLGFLGADGNVYKNSIQISLGAKDQSHLCKFMDSIGYVGSPNYRSDNNTYQLRVNSKRMVQSLIRFGIFPNKSLSYSPPNVELLGEQARHYWRGMVDGDGWVIQNSQKQKVVGLCGTLSSCLEFMDFLSLYGVETRATPHQNINGKNHFSTSIGGNIIVPKVLWILYGNSKVFLDRKYAKAMEMM